MTHPGEAFREDLQRALSTRERLGLLRRLSPFEQVDGVRLLMDGKWLLNFSSNDYLGLKSDARLQTAGRLALAESGSGTGASRLICGSHIEFHRLERELATFKGTEAALIFSTGYAANLGTLAALTGPSDVLLIDRLAHASLLDGARLSGALLRRFRHNDLAHLRSLLLWAVSRLAHAAQDESQHRELETRPVPRRRIFIVTESVFSMDGDTAPLEGLVALKQEFGAILYVDEAHSLGILGPNGRGKVAESGLQQHVDVQMGTLGKSVGAAGGYVCGCSELIQFLINDARSFLFSTAPPPSVAASAREGLRLIQSEEGDALRTHLWSLIRHLAQRLTLEGEPRSAIIPILLGEERTALDVSARLKERGFLIPAIRYPTVPRGQARLRITLSAAHSVEQVEALAEALLSLFPSHQPWRHRLGKEAVIQ